VIFCPNTSPLLILARIDRLDLLGDPARVAITRAVLDEIRDKEDEATLRVDALVRNAMPVVTPPSSPTVDASRSLGPGERSVLYWALDGGAEAVCVLDDAAARAEARRLKLVFTGTLGLMIRAKSEGSIDAVLPLVEQAVGAGLYLTDSVLAAALERIGESWSRR
jgi:predicted nucleic acid-binding protein